MDREILHERLFALKYVMESGQVDLGNHQFEIMNDLSNVKTGKDGMVEPETVTPALMAIIEATFQNEQ